MITEGKKTQLEPISNSIISNKELLTKHFVWEKYFQIIVYLIYGLFFSLIPSIFIFSKISFTNEKINLAETTFILSLLLAGIFSIYAIYWIFSGDFKKIYFKKYYITHIINATFLSAILLVLTIVFPYEQGQLNFVEINEKRLFLFLMLSLLWFATFISSIFITVFPNRKKFQPTFIKANFTFLISFIWIVEMILSFVFGIAFNTTNTDSTTLIYGLAIIIIAILNVGLTVYSFIFVKLYKETILADKTEKEISGIYNRRFLSFLFKFVIFISLIVFVVATFIDLPLVFKATDPLILAEIIIDALLIIFFITIVILQRSKLKSKNNNKTSFLSALDSEFILELLVWIIVLKGTTLASNNTQNSDSPFFILLISSISALLLLLFATSIGINFPNIKNTSVFIVNGVMLILVFITLVVFGTWYKSFQFNENIENVAKILLLEVTVGLTVNISFYFFGYLLALKSNPAKPAFVEQPKQTEQVEQVKPEIKDQFKQDPIKPEVKEQVKPDQVKPEIKEPVKPSQPVQPKPEVKEPVKPSQPKPEVKEPVKPSQPVQPKPEVKEPVQSKPEVKKEDNKKDSSDKKEPQKPEFVKKAA
ncbi:MAG: hypothetical protein ACRC9U_00190 [Metamycoplasmataceae bacterium]